MTVTTGLDRHIRLAEAAHRYYVDGWSQDQVAAHLDTSRSNVSRLLEAARRDGIVRFVIDHPLRRHGALEHALEDRFGVRTAIVLAGADPGLGLVGRLGARWLGKLDDVRIAIGWGRTVQAIIDQVATDDPRNVEVVQIGGDLTVAPAASGHELVRRLAGGLGGRCRFLHAPALVDSEETAARLRGDATIQTALELARRADVGLVGIGLPGVGFADRPLDRPHLRGAAAVVAARLVDHLGDELEGPLRTRVIALELDELRAIPTVAAAAAGAEKGPAIAAALRGRLVDVIICDQPAAAAALDTGEDDVPT